MVKKSKSLPAFSISSEITNISVTFGSQKSETTTKTSSTEAVASNVTAGGNVNITATGGGKDSNVNISGSNISGDKSVTIKADNDVNITSAQSTTKEESSNKSSGWSAGVTASVGTGGTGLAVTGSVNSGSGQAKGESVTNLNSSISSNGTTKIESGGTTTIAGGQVSGNRVEVDAKELKIESKQDTATYDSKQKNMSVGVSVNVTGIGGSANVSANKSNITSDYASVNQQSGIIAGDGGYKVTIKENTDLKGGIITSTQKAEDEGKNSITTGTLTSSDIENKSEHKGTGIGINAGVGVNQQKNINEPGKTGVGANVSQSIGIGSDKDKQTSSTNSGINTSNLTISDEAGQAATGKTVEQIKSEVKTETTSDKVAENSGALENTFDKDKVQKELDLQVAVTQEFSKNSAEVKTLIRRKEDELRQKAENETDPDKKAKLEQEADKWQKGSLLFDSITGALGAGNVGGTIAQAAQPWVAKEIGDYFKDKNAQGSAGHLLSHAILGAAVAAAGGDNPFAGGVSAAVAEGAAPKLAKWLYGTDDPSELTAEQKSTITSIVSLVGAGLGGAIGGDSGAVAGADAAQNATDNNAWIVTKNSKGKTVYTYREGSCEQAAKPGEVCQESSRLKPELGSILKVGKNEYDTSDGPFECFNGECVSLKAVKETNKKEKTEAQQKIDNTINNVKEIVGEKEAERLKDLLRRVDTTLEKTNQTQADLQDFLDLLNNPPTFREVQKTAYVNTDLIKVMSKAGPGYLNFYGLVVGGGGVAGGTAVAGCLIFCPAAGVALSTVTINIGGTAVAVTTTTFNFLKDTPSIRGPITTGTTFTGGVLAERVINGTPTSTTTMPSSPTEGGTNPYAANTSVPQGAAQNTLIKRIDDGTITVADKSNNNNIGMGVLKEDGTLDLAIYTKDSKGNSITSVRGSEIFDNIFESFKSSGKEIKRVAGIWGDSDNRISFNNAILKGISPEKAAFETFTGKMAQRRGFTKVVIDYTASKRNANGTFSNVYLHFIK